jgi:hypothetical protein
MKHRGGEGSAKPRQGGARAPRQTQKVPSRRDRRRRCPLAATDARGARPGCVFWLRAEMSWLMETYNIYITYHDYFGNMKRTCQSLEASLDTGWSGVKWDHVDSRHLGRKSALTRIGGAAAARAAAACWVRQRVVLLHRRRMRVSIHLRRLPCWHRGRRPRVCAVHAACRADAKLWRQRITALLGRAAGGRGDHRGAQLQRQRRLPLRLGQQRHPPSMRTRAAATTRAG